MRTARFIGSWSAGLIALALAVLLFMRWWDFVFGAAAMGLPTLLFVWMAVGMNLLVWTLIGVVRLGDDTARDLVRHRRGVTARRSTAVEGGPREPRPLAPAPAGAGDGTELASAESGTAVALAEKPGAVAVDAALEGPESLSLAVIIPAHNEEPVIRGAIESALRLFDRWDVYVVSDSSSDGTADIAAETGANVLELLTNRGKAGAIEAVIAEFELTEHYDGVVILDADTELGEDYVKNAKRQLRDPSVAAVAGYCIAEWKPQERSVVGRLISAYRDRLYLMLQYLTRFGQTWRFTSVTFIVPGFASLYRSSALRQIDVNPKGLVIEDFNMTFDVHRKRLGRVSMHPDTKAYCQDPQGLADYVSQVGRWTLGFWQTIRLHGVWPSLFWFALFCYILELLFVCVMFIVMVALGVFLALPMVTDNVVLGMDWYAGSYTAITAVMPLSVIAVGMFVPDYVLTCVVATIRRRPSYLVYGLFFLPLRLIDSYLTLRMIPKAWTSTSTGMWKSPGRVWMGKDQ